MATIEDVMNQEEALLGEIDELSYFVNELQGYLNSIKSMADSITPIHWDGGDRLAGEAVHMEGAISDIEMTVNDFEYDLRQVETYTDRILGAIEDLKDMTEEMEEEEEEA